MLSERRRWPSACSDAGISHFDLMLHRSTAVGRKNTEQSSHSPSGAAERAAERGLMMMGFVLIDRVDRLGVGPP
eukprot:3240913-Rhodomonas_salina.1